MGQRNRKRITRLILARIRISDYEMPMINKPNGANPVHVIGAGLAGSEAAWQMALAGVPVVLHEMRPARGTDAHKTDHFAELVCSNSFRSDDA
jgi:methylenetetrahydrofolate--tRNA-(uracil-5-)-methyltransferase